MCMIDQGDWLNIGEGYDPDVADGVSGKSQAIMIGPRDMKQGEHTIVVRNWGGDPRINDGKGSLAFDYITYTGDPQRKLCSPFSKLSRFR